MVKEKKLPILWDNKAKENLDSIYDFIAKDSINAARYVKKSLVELASSLNNFPENIQEKNI